MIGLSNVFFRVVKGREQLANMLSCAWSSDMHQSDTHQSDAPHHHVEYIKDRIREKWKQRVLCNTFW